MRGRRTSRPGRPAERRRPSQEDGMTRMRMVLTIVVLALVFTRGPAAAQTAMGFASYGGAYQDAQRKVMLEPAGKAFNVTFTEGQLFGVGPVREQVKSGQVKCDIEGLSPPHAA